MNDISLTDASFSEVLARVTYRWIAYLYRHIEWGYTDPQNSLRTMRYYTEACGFHALAFWIAAYAYAQSQGELTKFTRTAFIMRARMGMDFRSVALFDYKAARRRDPRVTNRGVITKATKDGR